MTDDDFTQLVLFKLLDENINNVKYVAVDYDGEIVCGFDTLSPCQVPEQDSCCWQTNHTADFFLSGIYIKLNPLPNNYKTVMITL